MKEERILLLAAAAIATTACASRGDGAADRIAYAQMMKDSTIAQLAKVRPDVEDRMHIGAGWAVLGTLGHRVLLPGTADGLVVAHENATGRETYLQMWGAVARGLPSERLRVVLLFEDERTLRHFEAEGWDFGASPPQGIETLPMVGGIPAPDVSLAGARVRPDADMNADR